MKTKKYAGYHLSPNYTALTVYNFDANGARICTDKFNPLPGMSRGQRYSVLCDRLQDAGFKRPVFQP